MSSKERDYVRYKGILFTKEDINKITGIASLDSHNIRFVYRYIRHVHEKTELSKYEIADMFGVNINFIKKIISGTQKELYEKPIRKISPYKKVEDNSLAISLKYKLGKTVFHKLFKTYNCSSKDIKTALEKIYRLWHELGNFSSLSSRLNTSPYRAHLLIDFIKENEIIRNFKKPRRKLTKEQEEQIIKAKELYDELKTLSNVGKRLRLTRERVRQILERGNKYGIIEYKTSHVKGFDDLANNLKKEELEKLLLKYGTKKRLISNLQDKFNINMKYLNALIAIYNIDLDYLIYQHKKNKCLSEYNDMVRELGFHPTTTVMLKRAGWRTIWGKIDRSWGSVDNFRKEFGIPIPKKGNPNFKEDMRRGREKRKLEQMHNILQFIEDNSPVTRKQIEIFLNWKPGKTEKHTKELVEKDKVDWMFDGKKNLYFRKK